MSIDLDGYRITGDGTGEGITDNNVARQNITVRNGVIKNFEFGILLRFSSQATVERMRVTQNTTTGMRVGEGSIIMDNIASGNGEFGIIAARAALSRAMLLTTTAF